MEWNGMPTKNILAWLEKQGEKKPAWSEDDERIRKTLIHIVKGACDKYGIKYQGKEITEEKLLAWLEKQGEQKSTDKVEPKFKVGDVIRNKWSNRTKTIIAIDNYQYTIDDGMPAQPLKVNINAQDNWELVEKKTIEIPFGTDSELVEETITIPNGCYAVIEGNKVILRKGEQKPAEWSEEDERIRQDIENLIHFALRDGSAVSPAADTTKEDAISWIQSLKERHTWKPSEEQIKLLREVQQALLGKDCHNRFVHFMYELKRLYAHNIQYTRTDAFIEKACEYLNKTCRRFILTEKDIEDFRKYMKGE